MTDSFSKTLHEKVSGLCCITVNPRILTSSIEPLQYKTLADIPSEIAMLANIIKNHTTASDVDLIRPDYTIYRSE